MRGRRVQQAGRTSFLSWDSKCSSAAPTGDRPLPGGEPPFGPHAAKRWDRVPPPWFLTTSTACSGHRSGYVAPRHGHGICCVSDDMLLTGKPARLTDDIPATRFVPLEEFPSTAAAPHHWGRCLPAVAMHPPQRVGVESLRMSPRERRSPTQGPLLAEWPSHSCRPRTVDSCEKVVETTSSAVRQTELHPPVRRPGPRRSGTDANAEARTCEWTQTSPHRSGDQRTAAARAALTKQLRRAGAARRTRQTRRKNSNWVRLESEDECPEPPLHRSATALVA